MDKTTSTSSERQNTSYLFVRSEYKILKIEYAKVLYIEALADYIVFQMELGQKIIVHSTMKGVEDKLPSNRFIRIHRSYIINIDKIEMIDNQMVMIEENGIPIGAHYKELFYNQLNFL